MRPSSCGPRNPAVQGREERATAREGRSYRITRCVVACWVWHGACLLMQRTVCCKILPSARQVVAFRAAMVEFAVGETIAARFARDGTCLNAVELHHLCYYAIRGATGLGANMTCCAIGQAAAAYKTLRANGGIDENVAWPTIEFAPQGAMRFDARTFRVKGEVASLWTLSGRERVSMRLGQRQRRMLANGKTRTADLVRKRRGWYLHIALLMPDSPAQSNDRLLGVDVGENTLAATSSGKILGGEELRHQRECWLALRRRLQSNGSQSAIQRLRKASGREGRHVRHVNHVASKQIVAEAIAQDCATISMEDLTHIRARIKAGRRMRGRLHRWAWRQLQTFVEYKAQGSGIGVVYVDPAYTSKTCADCLCLGTRRRHLFSCPCGSQRHADSNAAQNIRRLAGPIGPATRYVTAGHVALSSSGAA